MSGAAAAAGAASAGAASAGTDRTGADRATLATGAQRLRALHHAPEPLPLVLPNAWDAASARVLAEAGFPAIASSSMAVAVALGGSDREQTPADAMLAALARIVAAVEVPVTADVESGYGLAPAELVERVLGAGAVGINLEDSDHGGGTGLVAAEAQAERLAAVRDAADAAGVPLVLNARIDAHLHGAGVDESLRRARLYAAARADCVYPILLEDEAALARHVEEAGVPVNAMLRPGGPTLERLTAIGVGRVSLGGALFANAQAQLRQAADRLRAGRDPFSAAA